MDERCVRTKRCVWICTEEATTVTNRDETAQHLHLGRRQKKEAGSSPMLGSKAEDLNRVVAAVDVTQTAEATPHSPQNHHVETLERVYAEGVDGARRKL